VQGPILAFVYAVKELLGEGRPGAAGPGGSLPCNVVFVVEGEEENGSAGFRDVRLSMTFASLGNAPKLCAKCTIRSAVAAIHGIPVHGNS